MQSVPVPNQFEIGLASMTSILSEISKDSKKSLDIFDNIFSFLKGDTEKATAVFEPNNNAIFNKKSSNSDNLLQNIDKNISDLTLHFLKNKKDESDSSEKEKDVKAGNIFKIIGDLAKSLVLIKVNLTNKLINKMNKFGSSYMKFLDAPKEKHEAFSEGLTKFTENISKLGKTIVKPTYALIALAGALTVLTFIFVNPIFLLAVGAMGLILNVLTKFSDDKSIKNNNIDKLGYSILALTVAMVAMQFVNWESGAKMLLFIGGLNLMMRGLSIIGGPSNKTDGIKNNPMIMLALSIGILTLTMIVMEVVNWESGAKMIAFIGGLSLALTFINRFSRGNSSSNPLIQFALGIGILTLSMIVMKSVEWPSIFKMIVFIGLLGLTMHLFNFDEKGTKNSVVIFAFGIGLMTLAILALGEIPNEILIKGLLFVSALGLIMKTFNFDKTGPKNSMLSFAFGFGVMVLAMYAINELPWEALAKTLLFLGGLGLIIKYLFNGKEVAEMLGMGAGIALIAGALYIFKQINWTLSDAMSFGLTLVGLGAIFAAAGIPAVAALIGLGVLVMIGMSVGSILIALSLWGISNMNFNTDNITNFMLSAGILAIGFAALAIPAVLGLVGAGLFIPIAVAGLLGALSLWAISNMNFNIDNIIEFIKGAGILTTGFLAGAIFMIPAAASALLFLPVAAAAYLGAIALEKINSININQEKINSFGNGTKTLIESINDIGGWDLVKTAAKSVLLLPIFTAGWLASKVLSSISNTEFNPEKINSLGSVIDSFTTMMADTLSKNEDKLKNSEGGIEALAKLMSVGGGIANVIQMMANMKFYEYGVKDGKLVLTGVRTLTSDDFKRVGENLGSMLECLINPLLILGSDSKSFVIGGKVITNPFKSDAATKGIELLSSLGNAFKPLAESIKTYSSLPMVSNPLLLAQFNMSLITMTNTFMWMFKKLSTLDTDLIDDSIGNLVHFFDSLKNADVKVLTNLNDIFTKFTTNLSDDIKWKKIQNNLKIVKEQFGGIAKNINSIDISKATAFERNIKNLVEKNSAENLKQAVEALTELIGMVKNPGSNTANTNNFSNPSPNNPFATAFSINNNSTKENKSIDKSNKKDNKTNEDFETSVLSLLNDISIACSGIMFPKKMQVAIVEDLTKKGY